MLQEVASPTSRCYHTALKHHHTTAGTQAAHLQHGLDGLGVVQLLEHLAEEAVVAAIAITIAWGAGREWGGWGGWVSGLPGVLQARRAADSVGCSQTSKAAQSQLPGARSVLPPQAPPGGGAARILSPNSLK